MFAPEELGARIKQARDEAGITQADMAEIIGLSMRQVQNLESGASKPYKHITQIAEATGKTVEWLLHGDEQISNDERLAEALAEIAAVREQNDRILALLAERSQSQQEKA